MFQPPKKKATKSAKEKTSAVVDGLSAEDMSKEQVKLNKCSTCLIATESYQKYKNYTKV